MILVPIKQVPDSWSEKELDRNTKRLARGKTDPVLNDLDEFALEGALQLAEQIEVPTAVVTVGPDGAREVLLKALSMGIDEAYHVNDPKLSGACFMQTSAVLAAIAKKLGSTLIVGGLESTDSKGSVIPALIAARLGWGNLPSVSEVTINDAILRAKLHESDREISYSSPLPCVISLAENSNQPRFPSFKGIMAAKKKPITEYSIDDLLGLGFDDDILTPSIEVVDWVEAPPRTKGSLINDPLEGIQVLTKILSESKGS